MIVYKNVCDYCKNEEFIDEDNISFVINFGIFPAHKAIKSAFYDKIEKSFCCRDCMCEWFKNNLKKDGTMIEVK